MGATPCFGHLVILSSPGMLYIIESEIISWIKPNQMIFVNIILFEVIDKWIRPKSIIADFKKYVRKWSGALFWPCVILPNPNM